MDNQNTPPRVIQTRLSLPAWVVVLRHLFRMIYPVLLLAAAVFLFWTFGATGWLWLVLVLIVVLAFTGPNHPEGI